MIEQFPEIGITDTRVVIKTLKELYNYDFGDYALTSFKYRIEKILYDHGFKSADALIEKLTKESDYLDMFLKEISVPSTEIFRDPSFWRYLRDDALPKMCTQTTKPKIWLPFCISADELFSLCILLKESNMLDKVQVYASYSSNKIVESIRSGIFDIRKAEINDDNYNRFQGVRTMASYITINSGLTSRNISLFDNIIFLKQHINFENSPSGLSLIIFRNKMIYYNNTLKEHVLYYHIHKNLQIGGLLAIGIRECLTGNRLSDCYYGINESESIFRKKHE